MNHLDFIHFIKRESRRLRHCNPVYGWAVTIATFALGLMLIITLAPLLMQLMAFMLVVLGAVALLYWIATKTGFIDE